MGKCFSSESGKKEKSHKEKEVESKDNTKKLKSWEINKMNLRKEDYIFKNKSNETLMKYPGEINDQQFVIESCQVNYLKYNVKNSQIYLFDNSAACIVDDCENLQLFVGPCASSIFIRDCNNLKIIVACQQFRIKNCKDIDILLFCHSQPSLEDCKNIKIGCFKYFFHKLKEQFDNAKLCIWNNMWSDIFDFTKNENNPNFSLIDEKDIKISDFIPILNNDKIQTFEIESYNSLFYPITTGNLMKIYVQYIFVAVYSKFYEKLIELVPKINEYEDLFLIKSKQICINTEQLQVLFDKDKEVLNKKAYDLNKPILFLYFGGMNCFDKFNSILTQSGLSGNQIEICYIWQNEADVKNNSSLVFQTWNIEK